VLHLTQVDTRVAGADAHFPAWESAAWREVSRVHHPADARHAFAFDFTEFRRS
jgi:dihydrofolate reductase